MNIDIITTLIRKLDRKTSLAEWLSVGVVAILIVVFTILWVIEAGRPYP